MPERAGRAPRIARTLPNFSTIRAHQAEPYFAVAVATWGDLDRDPFTLYTQAAVDALFEGELLDAKHGWRDLPTSIPAARALAEQPPTDEDNYWLMSYRSRAAALLVGEAELDDYDDVVASDLKDLENWLWHWTRRNGVPDTVALRRRSLVRALEDRLYRLSSQCTSPADRARATAETRLALGWLSPDSAITLLLRQQIGRNRCPASVAAEQTRRQPVLDREVDRGQPRTC